MIAAAAALVIGRDGLAALSHRVVAREAGVPLTAVSYYYGSKDALLAAAVDHITQAELSMIRDLAADLSLDEVTPADAARAVANVIRSMVENGRGERIGHLEAMLHAARQDPPLQAPREWWEASCRLIEEILEGAGQADADRDASLIFAAGFGLYFAQLTTGSDSEQKDDLVPLLERLFQCLDARGSGDR